MTLTEIVDKGKKEKKLRELAQDFSEDQTINVVPAIARAVGDDSYRDAGYEDDDFLNMTPAANGRFLNDANARAQDALYNKVNGRVAGSIADLGNDDDGRNAITDLVIGIEAIDTVGSDEVRTAHKKAHKAYEGLQSPRQGAQDALDEVQDETIKGACAYLTNSQPGMANVVVQRRFARARNKLYDEFGGVGTARAYAKDLYDASGNDDKKRLGIAIGRKLTDIHG